MSTTLEAINELSLYHNKLVSVQFEKIHVLGRIVDRREIMGRTDWLFRPCEGEGRQWVTEGRIQIRGDLS